MDAAEPLQLRASTPQLVGLTALVAVGVGAITSWQGTAVGVMVAALGLLSLTREAVGIQLSESGVRFWGFVRPRTLRWSEIDDVAAVANRIHLVTSTTVYPLWAPRQGIVLRDPEFEAKRDTLTRWWTERRGGTGGAVQPPTPAPGPTEP